MTTPTEAVIGTTADITPPSAPATLPARRVVFAGFTGPQLVIGLALAAVLIWGMWVTRSLLTERDDHIVRADMSRIVGEYVQAQARSNTDPQEVQGEMRRFMAALETELQRRGANGQVVLVGEAILSKNVPDITASVATAVYNSGVKRPQPAMAPAQNAVPADALSAAERRDMADLKEKRDALATVTEVPAR